MKYAVGALFFLALFIISACENDMAEIQQIISKDLVGKEIFHDVEVLYSDSAIVRIRVKAPVMIRYMDNRNPRQEFPEGVEVDFFSTAQRVKSRLTAKYAVREENKKRIIVRDSVVLESVNRELLETSELIWDERDEKIHTSKFVMITTPEEKIWGYGFEANQEFTHWKIKAIEGELKVDNLTKELKN